MGLVAVGLVFWASGCDDGSSSGTDQPNSGGATGAGGSPGVVPTACLACGDPQCPAEANACNNNAACKELISCSLACRSGDNTCQNNCTAATASDSAAILAAADYLACLVVKCPSQCVSSVGAGGNGSGQNGGGASGIVGGGAGNAGTGANLGGAATTTTTKVVTYHCEGTSTVTACSQCGGTAPTCMCNSIAGCSGSTYFTCTGTPTTDCTQFDDFVSCESAGCKVDNSGNSICLPSPTCASLNNNANCTSLAGCKVSSVTTNCTGSPTVCTLLPATNCSKTPGCVLVADP